jgi:hypothetical protein
VIDPRTGEQMGSIRRGQRYSAPLTAAHESPVPAFYQRGFRSVQRGRGKWLAHILQLTTGDGCPLQKHLKAQITRELDRLGLLLEQIKAVEMERYALVAAQRVAARAPAVMSLDFKRIGPEFAATPLLEGLFRQFDPSSTCAVQRRDFPVGDRPTRQLSLRPVAIGAVVEVTKRLKPLV